MARRVHLLLTALVVLGLAAAIPPPIAAAGSVSASAWSCPPGLDPAAMDAAAFAAACAEPVTGLTFALTAGGATRRRVSEPDRPATWPAVSGPFTLALEAATGETAVVFCGRDGEPPERFDPPANQISGELTTDGELVCHWYRLAPASPTPAPSPTPTSAPPTPAPSPTPADIVIPTAEPTATAEPAAAPDAAASAPAVMFRGDAARTGHYAGPGPAGDPTLLWRYPIGTEPSSAPVIADGLLYVGGEAALFALDASTGAERWRAALPGLVTSSPAVVGDLVYVGAEDGALVALDAASGAERWRFATGGKVRSSPAVAAGLLVFTSFDGAVYALDAVSGSERWRFPTGADDLSASPAIADGTVYVGAGGADGGLVLALEAATGAPRWRRSLTSAVGSSPAVASGVVYVGSDDGILYALDAATGDRLWRAATEQPVRSSPAVVDDLVVVGSDDRGVAAFDRLSGEPRWRHATRGSVRSSPAVADGVLYVGSRDAFLYALSLADGDRLWRYKTAAGVIAAPAVAAGVVFVTSRDGFVYAIGGAAAGGEATSSHRPVDVPQELVVTGARYRFDRFVPLDPTRLTPIDRLGPLDVFAVAAGAPGPVYVSLPTAPDGTLARYLPEQEGRAQLSCPAENAPLAAALTYGESPFAFAGVEADLSTATMTQIANTPEVGAVYAAESEAPFAELFVATPTGLLRFVALDAAGLPDALLGRVAFAGQLFAFAEDATSGGGGARAGCLGPFAVDAVEATDGFGRLYVAVGSRRLAFDRAPTGGIWSAAAAAGSWWRPEVGSSWQIQLTGELNLGYDVAHYQLDLFDTPEETIAALHGEGRRVVCYVSVGTWEEWRPDAGEFPKETIGKPLDDWPGESWLDIRAAAVREIIGARFDLARAKGCDGVSPDNLDAFTYDTGFPLTEEDQLAFNRWLAEAAHDRGLAVGLKNVVEQAPILVSLYDFHVAEECVAYAECEFLLPFIEAGKPVFHIEYGPPSLADEVCPITTPLGFSTLIMEPLLDGGRTACT